MAFEIPQSMKDEHDELHATLVQATKAPGATGAAARAVAAVLHPHFVKEEAYALPPLGLLASLARGEWTPGMRDVLAMTERLKSELPQMLAEHRAIVAALDKLHDAARAEGHSEYAQFAHDLKLHAQTEEEVAYPAAILVGEYVKVLAARTPA
ncbi:MAG TPA: hemerythrin domain-containing protein [Burkholderiales bacterium]|nr:hemerythrin domain-containing protein [Burkholderiales bacterium]